MERDQQRHPTAVAVRAPLGASGPVPVAGGQARTLADPWRPGSTARAPDLMARGVQDPWEDLEPGTPCSVGVGAPTARGVQPVDTSGVVPQDPADGAPDWVRALEDAHRSDPRPRAGPVVVTDPRPDGSLDLDLDPDAEAGTGRGWWRHRDRLEQALAASVPGPRLATLLAEVDPAQMDDDSVVDLALAAARMASWSHALVVRIAGELAARPSMNPTWPGHVPSRPGRTPPPTSSPSVWPSPAAPRRSWSTRPACSPPP